MKAITGGGCSESPSLPLCLLSPSIAPAPRPATGLTVKITIKGADLTAPLEITGLRAGKFGVGEGPGVYVNGVEQAAGFIIDWPSGVVRQIPHGLQHYDVSFYSGCQPSEFCRTGETSLGYVVSYDYEASRQQGFIYLPGMGGQAFRFGQVMWHGHGLERYWLRSASAWENFVRPVIGEAARASR